MVDFDKIDLGDSDSKPLKGEKQDFGMWCMCGFHKLRGDPETETYYCLGCNCPEDECECEE